MSESSPEPQAPPAEGFKGLLRRTLRALGLYEWFKEETFAYDVYRRLRHGTPLGWRTREVRFYRGLLGTGAPLLIFDVGANRGQRTDVFLRLGASVVAVEPDEASRRRLARRYGGRLRRRPVTVVGKAVSERAGRATLQMHEPGSGLNTLSVKWVRTLAENPGKLGARVEFPGQQPVETTTLDELIASHGAPRYIKIDVEGHEVSALRGLHRSVPFVSFEANLPEFLPEAAECIAILGRLDAAGRFNVTEACHRGLDLPDWRTGPGMLEVLRSLGERSVEVFWRSEPPA